MTLKKLTLFILSSLVALQNQLHKGLKIFLPNIPGKLIMIPIQIKR